MYGHDAGGSRFSPLKQITRENVAGLEVAWTFHTGEPKGAPRNGREPALEVTPLVVNGTMYIITPMGRVIALDPVTGVQRWRHDGNVNRDAGFGDFTSRGVACKPLTVSVDTSGFAPGGLVTATVTCTIALSDLSRLGIPGTRAITCGPFESSRFTVRPNTSENHNLPSCQRKPSG